MRLGQPYAAFWDLTWREYQIVGRALRWAAEDRVRRDRILNQELAQLIAYAFHDPKNMPDLTKGPEPKQPSATENAQRLQAHLMQFFARHNAVEARRKKG